MSTKTTVLLSKTTWKLSQRSVELNLKLKHALESKHRKKEQEYAIQSFKPTMPLIMIIADHCNSIV